MVATAMKTNEMTNSVTVTSDSLSVLVCMRCELWTATASASATAPGGRGGWAGQVDSPRLAGRSPVQRSGRGRRCSANALPAARTDVTHSCGRQGGVRLRLEGGQHVSHRGVEGGDALGLELVANVVHVDADS
jgi:hypothetical protein